MTPAILLLVMLTTGCVNITTRLEPEDTSVKEVLAGSDCVDWFLGIGFGTATIEKAKKQTRLIGDESFGYGPKKSAGTITKVRRVEFTDSSMFLGGSRCVEVVGE